MKKRHIVILFIKFIRLFKRNAFKKHFWTKEEIEEIKVNADKLYSSIKWK